MAGASQTIDERFGGVERCEGASGIEAIENAHRERGLTVVADNPDTLPFFDAALVRILGVQIQGIFRPPKDIGRSHGHGASIELIQRATRGEQQGKVRR